MQQTKALEFQLHQSWAASVAMKIVWTLNNRQSLPGLSKRLE